jgi:TolB-like protein
MPGAGRKAREGGPLTRASTAPVGRPALPVALLAAALLAGCGPTGPRHSAGGSIPTDRPHAALLPFENLGGREEQGALFSKVFFAQLVASGALEMAEPGRVDLALDETGIRGTGTLTPAQVKALADTLRVPYVLLGSVLESGQVPAQEGTVPAVGATLRLVEAGTGRVLWAGVHFREGSDNETVFGWGRELSQERLVFELAHDMLGDFREAGAKAARRSATEAKR